MKSSKSLSPVAIAASVPIVMLMADLLAALKRRLRQPGTRVDAEPAPLPKASLLSQAAQSTLTATLRNVRDAIVVADAAGCVTQLNQPAENLTGWTLSAAQGRKLDAICMVFDEHTRRPLCDLADRCKHADHRLDPQQRLVLQNRAGHAVPVELRSDTVVSATGSLLGIVLVLRDLSAVRAADRQLETLAARAEEARRTAEGMNRSRDELLYVVAHQLRGPLNSIYGWVQLMQGGKLDVQQQERALAAIARGTHAQTRLIDELLDASQVMRGDIQLERSTLDVALVVHGVLDSVRSAAAAKEIVLDSALGSGAFVAADPERLRQVFGNLLDNAIRLTPPKGRIEVQLLRDNKEAVVCISDSGPGISASRLPQIFAPFQPSREPGSRQPGRGLGLGLALARRLAEEHNGSITARSAGSGLGIGATFTVRLPLLDQAAGPSPQGAFMHNHDTQSAGLNESLTRQEPVSR
jgi:PAS domain S-box-containing protein